jgi:hypothetical protein
MIWLQGDYGDKSQPLCQYEFFSASEVKGVALRGGEAEKTFPPPLHIAASDGIPLRTDARAS